MKIKNEIDRQREIEEMECRMRVGGMGLGKSKTLNRTPNHAVGEVYKLTALNTHDPENRYAWKDSNVPAWVWPLRLLGGLAFIVGIYSLVVLGMML